MMTMAWITRRHPTADATLAAARTGDADALERLLTPHVSMLRGVCRAQLGNADDAEDALQETLIRACGALARYRGDAMLRTFLTSIAIHVCTDQRRAATRYPAATALTESTKTIPSPESQTEARAVIHAALATLSPKRRAAFWLQEAEGWSLREIGAALGWPETRVKVELFRTRKSLAAWAANHKKEEL